MLKPFAEMLPFGRPVPVHKNWVKMVQAYFDGIQRICSATRPRRRRWTRPTKRSLRC